MKLPRSHKAKNGGLGNMSEEEYSSSSISKSPFSLLPRPPRRKYVSRLSRHISANCPDYEKWQALKKKWDSEKKK